MEARRDRIEVHVAAVPLDAVFRVHAVVDADHGQVVAVRGRGAPHGPALEGLAHQFEGVAVVHHPVVEADLQAQVQAAQCGAGAGGVGLRQPQGGARLVDAARPGGQEEVARTRVRRQEPQHRVQRRLVREEVPGHAAVGGLQQVLAPPRRDIGRGQGAARQVLRHQEPPRLAGHPHHVHAPQQTRVAGLKLVAHEIPGQAPVSGAIEPLLADRHDQGLGVARVDGHGDGVVDPLAGDGGVGVDDEVAVEAVPAGPAVVGLEHAVVGERGQDPAAVRRVHGRGR